MKKNIDYLRIAFISIPIYIFIISLFFGLPLYETNDDVIIMNILSGRFTGSPYPCTSFFSIFLGYIISSLYKIAYLPWYPAFVLISSIIGQMCILSVIYDLFKNKNINIFPKTLFFILYLTFIAHTILRPTYTTASVLLGVASIYFLNKKKLPLSLIFLMLSTMVRYESGFIACAFWGINYIYMHFVKTNKISLKFILTGILALVLVLGSYIGDETIKSHIEPKGFNSFMKAMQLNFDYYKTPEFEENKQNILSDAGIDETLYILNRNCHFLMDNRVNENMFNILNKYAFNVSNRSIKSVIMDFIGKISWNQSLFFLIFLTFSTGIYSLLYSFNKNKLDKIFIALILMLSLSLNAYLAIRARIMMRSLNSFALPSIIIFILALSKAEKPISKRKNICFAILALGVLCYFYLMHFREVLSLFKLMPVFLGFKSLVLSYPVLFILLGIIAILPLLFSKKILYLYMSVFIAFSCMYSVKNTISLAQDNKLSQAEVMETQENRRNIESIENYAYKNKPNIYVYGIKFIFDCRILVPKHDVCNLVYWGGTYAHSSAHVLQMKKAGLEKFDISELVKPNVYFVEHEYNTWLMDQIKHLLSTKGIESTYSFADYIDKDSKIGVFKFVAK